MPTVKNSPLVEIVAEVRWGPGVPNGQPNFVFGNTDVLFANLAVELGREGYSQLERTQPEGFPVQGGTIAFRYRQVEDSANTLFQLGAGVFTANGLPPYSSWKEFRPIIELGLKALFKVKPTPPEPEQIYLILRYIDAFTNEHLGEMSQTEFFEEVVGVRFETTPSARAFGDLGSLTMHFLSTQKSSTGAECSLEASPGKVKGVDAIILNTVAISAAFVPQSVDETLAMFEPLHDVLHHTFMEMMSRSAPLMDRLGMERT